MKDRCLPSAQTGLLAFSLAMPKELTRCSRRHAIAEQRYSPARRFARRCRPWCAMERRRRHPLSP